MLRSRGALCSAVLTMVGLTLTSPTPASAATDWCGDRLSVSQRSPQRLSNAPMIRVVVARSADAREVTNTDLGYINDVIQASRAYMDRQTSGTQNIRFDMGTSCGTAFISATVTTLSQTAAQLAEGTTMATVARDLADEVRASDPYSRALVFFLTPGTDLSANGLGQLSSDTGPGLGNGNNADRAWAYVTIDVDALPVFSAKNLSELIVHEVFHTFGAVNAEAPNTSGAGHCNDGRDVMCYPDGGPKSGAYSFSVCPLQNGDAPLDCNRDDYYSASPATGSYLATRWNTRNSVYLCETLTCLSPAAAPQVTATASSTDVRVGDTVTVTAAGARDYFWSPRSAIPIYFGDQPVGPVAKIPVTWTGPIPITVRGFTANGTWADATVTVTGTSPPPTTTTTAPAPSTTVIASPTGVLPPPSTFLPPTRTVTTRAPQAKVTTKTITLARLLKTGLTVTVTHQAGTTVKVLLDTKTARSIRARTQIATRTLPAQSAYAARRITLKPASKVAKSLRRLRRSFRVSLALATTTTATITVTVPKKRR